MTPENIRPSLVVTLRCQKLHWLCQKCIYVLSKWCDPPSDSDGWYLAHWTLSELTQSSTKCRCCQFLLRVVSASPWILCSQGDTIVIQPALVGSQHTSALERAFQDDRQSSTTYERYYRPRLKCLAGGFGRQYGKNNHAFIFPAAPNEAKDSMPGQHSPYAFHGRTVGAEADFSLIRTWFQKCASCHHGQHNAIPRNIPIRPIDEHDTSSRGCLPEVFEHIPNFRLVDVIRACIVGGEAGTDFAALSYVWGNASRLTLSHANLNDLSTPGALSKLRGAIPRTFQDAFEVVKNLSIRYLWIDALCIIQDDQQELETHMNRMESVYGAAILTIVSDTEDADMGIPGVSVSRGPPQATFEHGGIRYISLRPTFADTLETSYWERRAWCLQEKVFSNRLLVFSTSQVFYHCTVSTWFEDTITEPKGNLSGYVHMREKPMLGGTGKGGGPPRGLVVPNYTAYESHRETFGRGLWSLIEAYTRRQLSYDSDTLRAFTGILKSIEPQYGPALWGLPQVEFARGISFKLAHSNRLERRDDFPSWSWTGWKSRSENVVAFANYKRNDADMEVTNGKYHVSEHLKTRGSIFDLAFYYHIVDESKNTAKIKPVISSLDGMDRVTGDQTSKSRRIDPQAKLLAQVSISQRMKRWFKQLVTAHPSWDIAGHPGEKNHVVMAAPSPVIHQPGMPPLRHIIRFWTSVAKVLVEADHDLSDNTYRILIPRTRIQIGAYVRLGKGWSGGGKEHELLYISRWCHDWYSVEQNRVQEIEQERLHFASEADKINIGMGNLPERLNVMLVERVQGWGDVMRKVQLITAVSLTDWRVLDPEWKLVSLA